MRTSVAQAFAKNGVGSVEGKYQQLAVEDDPVRNAPWLAPATQSAGWRTCCEALQRALGAAH
jgi:hypothetical protein